jgi:hypothetical protein
MQGKPIDQQDGAAPAHQPGEVQPTEWPPALSPAKLAEKKRLAEALRANLRRRKAQIRQRQAGPGDESGPQEA